MYDLIFLAILLAFLALTLGLVRMCAALMPQDSTSRTGGKP
jgi:hypothetical protein